MLGISKICRNTIQFLRNLILIDSLRGVMLFWLVLNDYHYLGRSIPINFTIVYLPHPLPILIILINFTTTFLLPFLRSRKFNNNNNNNNNNIDDDDNLDNRNVTKWGERTCSNRLTQIERIAINWLDWTLFSEPSRIGTDTMRRSQVSFPQSLHMFIFRIPPTKHSTVKRIRN